MKEATQKAVNRHLHEVKPLADTPRVTPLRPLGNVVLTSEDLLSVHSSKAMLEALRGKQFDVRKFKQVLHYEAELEQLQIDLVKLQRWVQEKRRRLAIIFEGRDAAGK